jgi:Mg-chelatase subunit ChlD
VRTAPRDLQTEYKRSEPRAQPNQSIAQPEGLKRMLERRPHLDGQLRGPLPSEAALRVAATLDRSTLATGLEHEVYCVAEIAADGPPTSAERQPFDVAIVIDCSGSMDDQRVEMAKECALFVIGRLDGRDRAALITFDEEPQLRVSLSVPADELTNAIETLSAGGRTDLSAAFGMAVETLMSGSDAPRIRKIVLITDGEPNVGETDPQRLAALARQAGDDHDIATSAVIMHPHVLQVGYSMLEPGVAVHVAYPGDDALRIFGPGFDDLVNRVAIDASIELRPADGVGVETILRDEWSSRVGDSAALGQIFAGLTRRGVFRLRVPPVLKPGRVPLGEIALSYTPAGTTERHEIRAPLVVTAAEGTVGHAPDPDVMREIAVQRYSSVAIEWDRGRSRRVALASAISELQAMGSIASPMAEGPLAEDGQVCRGGVGVSAGLGVVRPIPVSSSGCRRRGARHRGMGVDRGAPARQGKAGGGG